MFAWCRRLKSETQNRSIERRQYKKHWVFRFQKPTLKWYSLPTQRHASQNCLEPFGICMVGGPQRNEWERERESREGGLYSEKLSGLELGGGLFSRAENTNLKQWVVLVYFWKRLQGFVLKVNIVNGHSCTFQIGLNKNRDIIEQVERRLKCMGSATSSNSILRLRTMVVFPPPFEKYGCIFYVAQTVQHFTNMRSITDQLSVKLLKLWRYEYTVISSLGR